MIYVKPRRRMNVERMRRQRTKHHDIRYKVWYVDRDDIVDLDQSTWLEILADMNDSFVHDVLMWNMWRKAPLSDLMLYQDYDIDFNRYKILFEIRRLR